MVAINKHRFNKSVYKRLEQAGEFWLQRQPAKMGDYAGIVEIPNSESMIYARLTNGQVVEAYNNLLPNVPHMDVLIGRDKAQPNIWKVMQEWMVNDSSQRPQYIAFHHKQHEYPAPDTVFVRRDQFTPLLVLPAGGFNVRLFGDVVYKPGMANPVRIENADLDLSSYVVGSGAKYVLLEVDTSGALNYIEGSVVGSQELLELEPLPTPSLGSFPICAFVFYEGQTELRRDDEERTIIDLRMFTSDSGGIDESELPTLTGDRVVFTDGAGVITTDSDLNFDIDTLQFVLGDRTIFPFFGNGSLHLAQDGVSPALAMAAFGSAIAPFVTGFKADGTAASPTNVKVDQVLFRLRARGHDGVGWSNTQGEIRYVADGDWSGSSHPIRIEFWVTPVSSGTLTLAMTIGSDGIARIVGGANLEIADAGSYFAGDTVEEALQEIGVGGFGGMTHPQTMARIGLR